jgi:hypothetical protein
VRVEDPDAFDGCLDDLPVALLAAAQRLLGALARGDVGRYGGDAQDAAIRVAERGRMMPDPADRPGA